MIKFSRKLLDLVPKLLPSWCNAPEGYRQSSVDASLWCSNSILVSIEHGSHRGLRRSPSTAVVGRYGFCPVARHSWWVGPLYCCQWRWSIIYFAWTSVAAWRIVRTICWPDLFFIFWIACKADLLSQRIVAAVCILVPVLDCWWASLYTILIV